LIQGVIELAGQFVNIAKPQIQRDASFIKEQAMASRQRQRPLLL